jgi:hypothetical protein
MKGVQKSPQYESLDEALEALEELKTEFSVGVPAHRNWRI